MLPVGRLSRRGGSSLLVKDLGDVFAEFKSLRKNYLSFMEQDLQSTNLVEVCMALTVVSQIFPREMIPAVLPLIEDKLQHSKYVFTTGFQMALYSWIT